MRRLEQHDNKTKVFLKLDGHQCVDEVGLSCASQEAKDWQLNQMKKLHSNQNTAKILQKTTTVYIQ